MLPPVTQYAIPLTSRLHKKELSSIKKEPSYTEKRTKLHREKTQTPGRCLGLPFCTSCGGKAKTSSFIIAFLDGLSTLT